MKFFKVWHGIVVVFLGHENLIMMNLKKLFLAGIFSLAFINSCNNKPTNCDAKLFDFVVVSNSHGFVEFSISIGITKINVENSCDFSDLKVINSVSSVTIKSVYDFSEDFLSGSDVTSLFNSNEEKYSISGGGPYTLNYYLLDAASYCAGGLQKFEITVLLSDGTLLVRQTEDFQI